MSRRASRIQVIQILGENIMGIATEHAPAPSGGMKPYTLWEIDVRFFNDAMVEIGKLSCRQDLWVGEGQFVVRLTPIGMKNASPYEDRGSVDGHGVINGVSGFGGAARRPSPPEQWSVSGR
jgi:hypothetical protein